MIELVRNWLIGITCSAMIVALAEGLMPPGTVRKIGMLTGGLVLLLAILQPVLKVDHTALAQSLSAYRADLGGYSAVLEEENTDLMKGIIEERSDAYILDKATALGIAIDAAKVTTTPGEGNYPVPTAVTIRGHITAEQKAILTRQIEADFAIPAERQTYLMEGSE